MDRQALQERFGLVGDSPALRHAVERARQVAGSDITVLLEGESGTGKELFASAIHGLSRRRHRRLVVVNCGAIPEGLIESELFGAEKGAYTGSVERRTGYFEEANGGTLFLDEIGEMPASAQVRLLRVLETGQFSRVGSATTLTSDARVVAATNKDLGAEVGAGRFREDLYYRLSTVTLRLPPLRERGDDVRLLFDAFLRRFAEKYDAPVPRLTPDASELLRRYNWPGNVRELRNTAEQTVVLTRGLPVTADVLRPFLRGVSAGAGLAVARGGPADERGERELLYHALLEIRAELRDVRALLTHLAVPDPNAPPRLRLPERASTPAWDPAPEIAYQPPDVDDADDWGAADTAFEVQHAAPPESLDDALATGLPLPTIEAAEASLIREALRRHGGNRRATADALGISERTLYRKIKEME